MRIYYILLQLTLFVLLSMCSKAPEKLLFEAQYPQPGQEIIIRYNPSGTVLENVDEITLVAYCFQNGFPVIIEIVMEKSHSVWQSTLITPDSTLAVYIVFRSDVHQDDNDRNGYIIPLYTADKIPVEGRMQHQAKVVFYGGPCPCLQRDWEKAKYYLNREFKIYASQVQNLGIINSYWYPVNDLPRDSVAQIIRMIIEKIGHKKEKTFDELSLLINWYKELNEKELVDIYKNELLNRAEEEHNSEFDRFKECAREKSINRKHKLTLRFLEDFPNSKYTEQLHDRMISEYYKKGLYKEMESYFGTYMRDSITRFLDDLSWSIIKGEIIQKKYVEFTKMEVEKARTEQSTKEKPDHYTEKDWQEEQNQDLVDALDTYGFGLYTLGKVEESISVFEEAVELDERKNKLIHESYCRSLFETDHIEKAFTEMELLFKDNPWDKELRTFFEEIYIKRYGSRDGLDSFLVAADKSHRIKRKEEIKAKMMNKRAPLFVLNDLDGNVVKLADFKDKIIILDFWAPWCGPCIAGFPTMQKSVDKYKDDDDVKFLFISTFRRIEDASKRARDLINKNNYTFQVLVDEDSCVTAIAYKLIGIPSKFVIDKQGIIRFRPKKSGKDEMEFVEELDIMIEMLR